MFEVVEVYLVIGDYDYLFKVVVKNVEYYECFLCKNLYLMKGVCYICFIFVLCFLKFENKFDFIMIE